MIAENATPDGASDTIDSDELELEATDCHEHPMNRRNFMKATAATGAALAIASSPVSANHTNDDDFIDDDVAVDFSSDYVHDPYITETVKVYDHGPEMGNLEYIDDSGEVRSLEAHGYALARDPEDEDTLNNPVTLKASDFDSSELSDFPRGATYDHDTDSSTDEEPVHWHEADHWTEDESGGGAGTITLTELTGDALQVASSGLTSSDVVTATFDLSSVASDDMTITSSVAQRLLQMVVDVDTLPSGALVEFAVIASDATEVVATFDGDGDASTTKVLTDSTGDSQVHEIAVGDLEDDQSKDLADVEKLEIRIKDADADFTLHGLNLERATVWTWGTEEFTDTDDDGDNFTNTRDVEGPSGSFSITSLETLGSTPFHDAEIGLVEYDAEQRASLLPDERVHARVTDTPDTYDQPKELEIVAEFEAPVAYSLDVTASKMLDEGVLPSGRINAIETKKDASEVDEWEDVEDNITWTSQTSTYGSVGSDLTVLSAVTASQRNTWRSRTVHNADEIGDATSSSGPGAAVAVGSGGGGFSFDSIGGILTAVGGIGLAALVAFRKNIRAWIGG